MVWKLVSNACDTKVDLRKWIVLSTCCRKWQLMEDVKGHRMNEGFVHGERLKV